MNTESIAELEKRLAPVKVTGTPDDFARLASHYDLAADRSIDFRERQELLKRAAHFCARALDAGESDPSRLRTYVKTVRQASAVSSYPQEFLKIASRINQRWLEALGADNATVLQRKKMRVGTDCASFVLCDETEFSSREPDEERESRIAAAVSARRLHIQVASDGGYPAEMRLVEGPHPVLEAKEYAKLSASLEPTILNFRSGGVLLADPNGNGVRGGLSMAVPPGFYLCGVFGFVTASSDRIIVVIAKQDPPTGTPNPDFSSDAPLFA